MIKILETTSKGDKTIDAGDFSSWLSGTVEKLTQKSGVDVPCGTCIGCCSSSYFIHIEADETETLKMIPRNLVFNAPKKKDRTKVVGYDSRGHCPMLLNGRCSIYNNRPRTCRSYDCRIFAAAGISAGDNSKKQINERVGRWSFRYKNVEDERLHDAIKSAALFLTENKDSLPHELVFDNETQLALSAIRVHKVFISLLEGAQMNKRDKEPKAIIKRMRAFINMAVA
jgi:Fe-S-cluster containining protein